MFMGKDKKPSLFKNAEGYPDPTVGEAMANIAQEEQECLNTIDTLIHVMKSTAELAGFRVVGRITLLHKKTGKKYK